MKVCIDESYTVKTMAEAFAPSICTPLQLAAYQDMILKLLDGHLSFDSTVCQSIAAMKANVPREFSGDGPYPMYAFPLPSVQKSLDLPILLHNAFYLPPPGVPDSVRSDIQPNFAAPAMDLVMEPTLPPHLMPLCPATPSMPPVPQYHSYWIP
ncbi:hypothetical protein BD311DRAFT_657571 [Dichomitus squalens]|uniref:Uncharacterized protein n=1 Tax=Dichomitus squalens TaxID=114155 RepID=A0A4Q9MUV5_9APHY|nr:hypothetical protein BD311DRAFT_657571 [Dichomitus squalens]